jgi:hypothetical protein
MIGARAWKIGWVTLSGIVLSLSACAMETGTGEALGERRPGPARYELLGAQGASAGSAAAGSAPVAAPVQVNAVAEPQPQPWNGPQEGTDNGGEPQPQPWMNGADGTIVNASDPNSHDHDPHFAGKL